MVKWLPASVRKVRNVRNHSSDDTESYSKGPESTTIMQFPNQLKCQSHKHRTPIILICVTALFRMRAVAVGNHALFISKHLDHVTVWDGHLHASCFCSNVAFWDHIYLYVNFLYYLLYYCDIINIQWVQQPFTLGMKPLEREDHSPSIPSCNVEVRNRWSNSITPTSTLMERRGLS